MAYRVKEYFCGDYAELDIFPVTKKQMKQSRKEKKKESAPKQKNLNDKNSKKHFRRKVHLNFTSKDIAMHLTYSNEHLPPTEKEYLKDAENFLRTVRRRMAKQGLPKLKYMIVHEYANGEDGKTIRAHHHIIMSGGLDRDELEKIWKKGWANSRRLRAEKFGFEALVNYIMKDPKGRKRWRSSLGLKNPTPKNVSDHKYSKSRVIDIAKNPDDTTIFEKNYPGYELVDCKVEINDYTAGIHLEIKLRKLKD